MIGVLKFSGIVVMDIGVVISCSQASNTFAILKLGKLMNTRKQLPADLR